MDEKIYQIIYHWVKMCAAEVRQKMNCHIYLIIYWILLVMKKYWDCIKECVEGICIYILVVLRVILKHIGKCGKMKIVIQQIFLKRKENKVFRTL